MCLLPGEIGKAIRTRMANVAARADVGDEDLENAIHERREKISPHEQEIFMNGMASSEKVLRNREERKEKVKKIEFDGPLVRHLQTTRAPKIVLTDDALRMEWNLHARSALTCMEIHWRS